MALIGEMQYLTIGGNTYSLPVGGGGTVTSVAVSNATNGGLSVSGSPISSSGTITIGHSNVLAAAQTTQAVYPIKIDKNGHISEYGNAVTIPTVNDATFTIQKNGANVETFSANAASNKTANIVVNEVPSGGTSGQVLTKHSATNYDVEWADASAGAFIVTFTYDDANDSWSCDKTAQQIYEAYQAGKTILAKENNSYSLYYLDYIDYDEQENYYDIKFTTQTGAESEQDGVYIYNSVFYYSSSDGIFQQDYNNDIISGVSDVEVDGDSVVTDGIAYINTPDMSNFVENFSSGDITSSIRPWVEGGFGYIRYRDQSFNEDHVATIDYGVQRESNVSYSQISLGADKIDLNGRISFYNGNNSNYRVYLDVPANLANAVNITLPSNNGTLALTSDLHNIPSGGTSGQVLTKHSATNYDVEWVNVTTTAAQIIRWTEST